MGCDAQHTAGFICAGFVSKQQRTGNIHTGNDIHQYYCDHGLAIYLVFYPQAQGN